LQPLDTFLDYKYIRMRLQPEYVPDPCRRS